MPPHATEPPRRVGLVAWLLLALISAYQLAIRPLLVGTCKFVPSCSVYAAEAVKRHGALRGGWLAARRVARCRPGTLGGLDPVPPVGGGQPTA